jgi:hypothetical protein
MVYPIPWSGYWQRKKAAWSGWRRTSGGKAQTGATHRAVLDALLPGKRVQRGRCVPIPERTMLAANIVKEASTFFGRL